MLTGTGQEDERGAHGIARRHMAIGRFLWVGSWIYPEMRLFPTEAARRRAERGVAKIIIASPRAWLVLAAAVMGAGVFTFVAFDFMLRTGAVGFFVIIALEFACTWIIAIWVASTLASKVRPFLRQCLLETGVAVCARCCYNLAGNTSGICPECGTPISEDVQKKLALVESGPTEDPPIDPARQEAP